MAKTLLVIALSLSCYNSFGQVDSLNKIHQNYRITKFALGNLIWQAIRIKGKVNLSVEQEIGINRKFSMFIAGDYSKADARLYLNGRLAFISTNTSYLFRPGVRFYLRESPNGLFLGSSLLYQRRIESDGLEKKNEVGLIGGIGWQKIIKKKVAFDIYIFYGRSRLWVRSNITSRPPKYSEFVSAGIVLINVGLVRYKKGQTSNQ